MTILYTINHVSVRCSSGGETERKSGVERGDSWRSLDPSSSPPPPPVILLSSCSALLSLPGGSAPLLAGAHLAEGGRGFLLGSQQVDKGGGGHLETAFVDYGGGGGGMVPRGKEEEGGGVYCFKDRTGGGRRLILGTN